MALVVLLMLVIAAVVVTYFWQLSPPGVSQAKVIAANVLVLALAGAAALLSGYVIYRSGMEEVEHKAELAYLAIMAGGMAFLLVVLVGGVIRNLVVFPRSRRAPQAPA